MHLRKTIPEHAFIFNIFFVVVHVRVKVADSRPSVGLLLWFRFCASVSGLCDPAVLKRVKKKKSQNIVLITIEGHVCVCEGARARSCRDVSIVSSL